MRTLGQLSCAIAAAAAVSSAAVAAVHPLSTGTSSTQVVSSPGERAPRLDSTGRWAVYLADSATDGMEELWSAHLAGGAPIPLSGDLGSGGSVVAFEIAPDGSYVAFLASYEGLAAELFVAPIGGGAPAVKSHPLGQGDYVADFRISPDSEWLVYRARVDDGSFQLFRVAVDSGGAAAYEYLDASSCAVTVESYTIASDSSLVGFRTTLYDCANPVVPDYQGLWVAPTGSTSADRVFARVPSATLSRFGFTSPPEQQTPVLLAIDDADGAGTGTPAQLVWVDSSSFGGDHIISGSIVAGGNVVEFAPVPGSQDVVFLADREEDGRLELFRTTAGVHFVIQTPVQLHENLSTSLRLPFAVAPDGSRAVFVQDDNTIGSVDYEFLRSGSIPSPGSSVLLDQIFVTGDLHRFEITPDSSRVVFLAEHNEPAGPDNDRDELFSVPISGGAVSKLNPTFSEVGNSWDVTDFAVSPDGTRTHLALADILDFPPANTESLYSVPTAGGAKTSMGLTIDLDSADGYDDLLAPLDAETVVSLASAVSSERHLRFHDLCLFCDGFEGTGDGMERWD